jgi:cell division protein FtsI (penicillin-binding protein 3)
MEVKKDIVIRLGLIYLVAFVIAIMIVGQIVYLQISRDPKYPKILNEIQYKTLKTKPVRGNICDCNGKVLATSLPFYEIRMDLLSSGMKNDTFQKYIRPLTDSLSKFFKDKSSIEYFDSISKARKDSDRYYLIKQEVTYQQYQKIKNFPLFKLGQFEGGFIAIPISKRIQPYKGLASRTIGSLQYDQYIGIEGYFHNELAGQEKEKLFKKIGKNLIPVDDDYYLQASSGMDIITTLDINYQDFAHNALLDQMIELDADTGIVVLMEVKTGEIKAMVNLSKIAPGKFIEGSNLAVKMSFEPGSTFKLMSLMAALEDNCIDLKDSINTGNGTFTLHGFTIREAGSYGYGTLTVQQVFEKSSNVGTAMLIYKNYNSSNKEKEKKFLNRLSSMDIDKKTFIEVHGEANPKIKNPNYDWSKITLPQMSIGYEIKLTPLQILNFYNAVANNGVMVKPRLVKAIRDQGKIIKEFGAKITNPSICTKATIERAKIMLEGVVKHGTAENIDGAPYKIAGKTGTAQVAKDSSGYKEGRSYFGSFVGYFPADNPVYSCIVVIKTKNSHKFYGNIVAAPVFRKIADKVYASSPNMRKENNRMVKNEIPQSKDGFLKDLDFVYDQLRIPVKGSDKIQSQWVLTIESNTFVAYQNRFVKKNKVPNVVGMGLKDAIFLLESAGLKVIIKGKGKIIEQSLEAGNSVEKNQTITIILA